MVSACRIKIPSYKWVDLTHAFDDGSPHWQGFPAMTTKLIYDYKNGDIFQTQQFTVVGQYGTHVDAPIHFYPEGRTLDEIEVTEFTYPLCVIDVHNQVAANPDYALSIADIKAFEESYGPIPDGAFVAMRSDWCKRWPDEKAAWNLTKMEMFTIRAGASKPLNSSSKNETSAPLATKPLILPRRPLKRISPWKAKPIF